MVRCAGESFSSSPLTHLESSAMSIEAGSAMFLPSMK